MSPISEGSDPEPSAGALERLTSGVASRSQRDILIECLAGRIPPAIALMRLHDETPDTGAMRAIIDEVTRRAALLSRATDSLLRDRVDDLTQLMVETEPENEELD